MKIYSWIDGFQVFSLKFWVDVVLVAVKERYGSPSGPSGVFVDGYAIAQAYVALVG